MNGFNTQPPEGDCGNFHVQGVGTVVSTHSRPKATVTVKGVAALIYEGFNTQPPEGDWWLFYAQLYLRRSFNTQPPEGDCL